MKFLLKYSSAIIICCGCTLLSACFSTGNRYLQRSSAMADYEDRQRGYERERERIRQQNFRLNTDKIIDDKAQVLSNYIFKECHKGDFLEYQISDMTYDYNNETADCVVTVTWMKGRKPRYVKGRLYYSRRQCIFRATEADPYLSKHSPEVNRWAQYGISL